MKQYRSKEMREVYNAGGYRERYAMDNGNKAVIYINGEKCFRFTYSSDKEYQDANGAIYNAITKAWIN